MSNFTKKVIAVLVAGGFCCFAFFSCQKANPAPYGDPNPAAFKTISTTPVDTTPSFTAEMNGSFSATSFTPLKTINGSYTTLKGVSTYYTVTMTFPSSSGPGNYEIGGLSQPDYTATIVTGSGTYVINTRWGLGSLKIDSISSTGKYYGTFSLEATDTVTHSDMEADQGTFYHL